MKKRGGWVACLLAMVAGVALAKAPPGHYQSAPDGVRDSGTGLTWEQSFGQELVDWEKAKARCAEKGAGWRLPTIRELHTLIDEFEQVPAIDPGWFKPSSPSVVLWSSSDPHDVYGDRWVMYLETGENWYLEATKPEASYVCVKGP